jgi:hypothetical protein
VSLAELSAGRPREPKSRTRPSKALDILRAPRSASSAELAVEAGVAVEENNQEKVAIRPHARNVVDARLLITKYALL